MINKSIVLLSPFQNIYDSSLVKRVRYLQSLYYTNYEDSFLKPLNKIFSKVFLYDYIQLLIKNGFKKLNEELINLVKKEKPEYILWIAIGEYYEIKSETFDLIKQNGTKIIGWFFDDEVRFDYYSQWWVPYLDFVITNDPTAVSKYENLGIPAIFATPDVWNAEERDWRNKQEKYEVSFVGSFRADRRKYMNFAKKNGIFINLFGISANKTLSFQEIKEIFWQSKINLNFSKTYDNNRYGIKGRIFNVPLSGGFLATEYFPGIEKFFKLDKEIVCFRNPSEMVEKIKYYLVHDKERITIAKTGWERACREYDSFVLLSKIFEEIEKYFKKSNTMRNCKKVEYPKEIKNRISYFYFHWGQAFLIENYKNFWHDAFSLSLDYSPHNLHTKIYLLLGKTPHFLRFIIFLPNIIFYKLWCKIKPLLLNLSIPQNLLEVYYTIKRKIKKVLFKDFF